MLSNSHQLALPLWHAMTGHMLKASVAILAAATAEGQCASEALLDTWHRLTLAVLHSFWAASQIAQHDCAGPSQPQASPAPSNPPAQLASRLALKTVTAMVRQDWAKYNDDLKLVAGLCSSWLWGRVLSMTSEDLQSLWCDGGILASIRTVQSGTGVKLELYCDLSASYPVAQKAKSNKLAVLRKKSHKKHGKVRQCRETAM